MTLLNISNLSASIHNLPILHDIDLRVDAGQIVAITGVLPPAVGMTTHGWSSRLRR